MNGECCFARAGSNCYAHWKAGKWNRAHILSCVNLHVQKGNLRLTGSSPELCSAVSGSSSGRDPLEMTLGYPSCGFLSF